MANINFELSEDEYQEFHRDKRARKMKSWLDYFKALHDAARRK